MLTSQKSFQIAFFSSSSFCIPIVQSIKDNQGKTLLEIYSEQVIALRTKTENSCIWPLDFDIQDIEELDLPIELSIVVSQPDSNIRKKTLQNPVSKWATDNQIKLFNPVSFNKSRDELDLNIDLSITSSFGQLVSESSLIWPKHGFINWHPSLLPQYRGATPMQSAIKDGNKESGLSWINMTKGMDEGDVFVQFLTNIEEDNFDSLSQRLGILGSKTWAIAVVNKILNKGKIQDRSQVTLCSKLSKEDALVDTNMMTAKQIQDQVRAFNVFPGTIMEDARFEGLIRLNEVKSLDNFDTDFDQNLVLSYDNWIVAKDNKKQVVVLKCKDDTYLQVNRITLPTGKQLDLSGYQFKHN